VCGRCGRSAVESARLWPVFAQEWVIVGVRVVEGRLVEHLGVPDRFALLHRVGLLDRSGAGVEASV
jgi:hypothetical protein